MTQEYTLNTLKDTEHYAVLLTKKLPTKGVITFSGKMGSGKTTFISFLITELYKKHNLTPPIVTSPTFSIVNEYNIHTQNTDLLIAHFDLFRINAPDELLNIGFDDYQDDALCLIEWPENAASYLQEPLLKCNFMQHNDIRYLTLPPNADYTLI